MKRIVLCLAVSTLSLFAADNQEYPVGIVVYPRGAQVVLSSGRTIDNGPITVEPHMIQKAKLWKAESKTKVALLPEIACEVMQFIPGSDVRVGLEIHFYSPEEILQNNENRNRFLRHTV